MVRYCCMCMRNKFFTLEDYYLKLDLFLNLIESIFGKYFVCTIHGLKCNPHSRGMGLRGK